MLERIFVPLALLLPFFLFIPLDFWVYVFNNFIKKAIDLIILKIKNIFTNQNFIFINKNGNLGIIKTKKSETEVQVELNKLNIPNFDFDDYFIFIEKDKIKQLKQEKLFNRFEKNIQNLELRRLKNFKLLKKQIKTIKKKNIEKIENTKINRILFKNTSNKSFNKKISLENSIKEIKN